MRLRLLALTGVACLACSGAALAADGSAKHAQIGAWGFDLAGMDKSVKPGDNFFMYANGTWYKDAVIPADRATTGTVQNLRTISEHRMMEIAGSLDARPYDQLSAEEKKLRDFYDAFNDQKQIDSRGLEPVKADLAYISSLKTPDDVAAAMATTRLSLDGPFLLSIGIDQKNPNAYVVDAQQSGLGMPDRDYYLKDDKDLNTAREAYKKYLAQMMTLTGLDNADKRAAAVYNVEHKIAEETWPNEDRRDQDKTYNPMTFSQLKAFAPQFPWDAYFKGYGVSTTNGKGERTIIVAEKASFPKLAKLFADTPVSVWRDYLTARYMASFAAFLPKNIDDANFAFKGTVLQGNAQQLPRNARAAHWLDNNMGEALGKLYAAKYFPPEAKAKAEALVHNLIKAYEADVQTLDWMSDASKKTALEKLHKLRVKLGYPDTWRDYSALEIKRDNLIGDVQRATEFEWHRQLARIDQPVDRAEWGMTPPTVNAYNNPQGNEIVFPAGILQPPYFDANADGAVNYGAIGAVIGHEISHGFDDQGAKFNADGMLQDWWAPQDLTAFKAKTAMLKAQYDAFEPLPGLHINGAFTMGENIADDSGLAISLKAYHISLGGKKAPVLDGFTGDQRFYLGFSNVWKIKMRDGALRQQVLSNEHSPAMYRAIGAPRNQNEWYTAFDVKPGDKNYVAPDQRVHIW